MEQFEFVSQHEANMAAMAEQENIRVFKWRSEQL